MRKNDSLGIRRLYCFLFLLFVGLFLAMNACADKAKCKIVVPELQVGKEARISFQISGGSGKYSDITLSINPMYDFSGSGKATGENIIKHLKNAKGSYKFVVPGASNMIISIDWKDTETGEEFSSSNIYDIKENPDFDITFKYSKSRYKVGDTVKVQYKIAGITSGIKNAKVWWGWQKGDSWPDFHYDVQTITSPTGSVSFKKAYGRSLIVYISGVDNNGNIFYAASDPIMPE